MKPHNLRNVSSVKAAHCQFCFISHVIYIWFFKFLPSYVKAFDCKSIPQLGIPVGLCWKEISPPGPLRQFTPWAVRKCGLGIVGFHNPSLKNGLHCSDIFSSWKPLIPLQNSGQHMGSSAWLLFLAPCWLARGEWIPFITSIKNILDQYIQDSDLSGNSSVLVSKFSVYCESHLPNSFLLHIFSFQER